MIAITEGALTFTFADGWEAAKSDEWSFYKNQFMKLGEATIGCSQCEQNLFCANCGNRRVAGTKGIDILAIDGAGCCWCIEIKDYRQSTRTATKELASELALKVRDTLAALVAARINAYDSTERDMANRAMRCDSIRVVLHLELPSERSSVNANQSTHAYLTQKLRQSVKAIDPHPRIVHRYDMGTLAWTVSQQSI
jgi:hypothetical protein